jgi:hypothetical protein
LLIFIILTTRFIKSYFCHDELFLNASIAFTKHEFPCMCWNLQISHSEDIIVYQRDCVKTLKVLWYTEKFKIILKQIK